jgi:hypothetical protein
MRQEIVAVAVAVMLAGHPGLAHGQIAAPTQADQLNLTQAQELTILSRVENEQPQAAPAAAELGAPVPDGVQLKRLPSDVGAQIPEAERFHYAKLEDKVVLVDPANKHVVKVIRPQAPIGAGSPGALSGSGGTTGSAR